MGVFKNTHFVGDIITFDLPLEEKRCWPVSISSNDSDQVKSVNKHLQGFIQVANQEIQELVFDPRLVKNGEKLFLVSRSLSEPREIRQPTIFQQNGVKIGEVIL